MALTNVQGKLVLTNSANLPVEFPIINNSLSTSGNLVTKSGIITTNLISYWKLEEDSNATGGILDTAVTDFATGTTPANNGTRFGTTPFIASGISGNAHTFSGDDYILVPNSSSLNPAAFTFSCWFYVTSFNSGSNVLAAKSEANPNVVWWFSANPNGSLTSGNSVGSDDVTSTSGLILVGKWYYATVTHTGTLKTIYLNGVSVGSVAGATLPTGDTNPFYIGGRPSHAGYSMIGSIDEVVFYNRALTGTEVLQNYQAYSTSIVTSGLVSWWKFDGNYNDTALADAGVGASPANNGTLVGGTYTFTSTPGFSPPVGNNGFLASTSADYITIPNNSGLQPTTAWSYEFRGVNHIAGTQKSTVSQYYFDNGGSAQGSNGFSVGTTDGVSFPEELQVRVKNASTTDHVFVTTGTAFPNDTVVYFSVTWDGSIVKIYKDGKYYTSFAYTGTQTYSVSGAAFSGRITQPDGISGMYSGSKMDFFRLYSRALTEAEVLQNYTASIPAVVTDGLGAWFKFNGNSKDSGPNSVQLTLVGNETYVQGPNNAGQGIYYDGSSYHHFISSFTRGSRFTMDGWYRHSNPAGTSTFTATGTNSWTGPSNDSPSFIWDFDPATGNSATPSLGPRVNIGSVQHLNVYWPAGTRSPGSLGIVRGQNGGSYTETTSATAFGEDLAKWHHIVISYDGTRYKLYIDRVLRISHSVANPGVDIAYGTTLRQTIGGNGAGGSLFNGCISSLKYYNRALTDGGITSENTIVTGEVAQNYFAEGGGY